MHWFLKSFILGRKIHMFRIVSLSIIRSFSLYTQQWYMSYRFADSLRRDEDGTSWSRSQAVSKPVWHIPLLCVQWKTPDNGQRNCPKHVDFPPQNKKSWEINASSWFIIKKFVTMHGHMNVKLTKTLSKFSKVAIKVANVNVVKNSYTSSI
jgi:hypothetical protein